MSHTFTRNPRAEVMVQTRGARFVVIGGTAGIGRAIASELRSLGEVHVGGRDAPRPELDGVAYSRIDVTEESSVVQYFSRLRSEGSGLDGLVYAAGVATPDTPIEQFDVAAWDATFAVNVTGAMLCFRESHDLLARARGRVVAIGSLATRQSSGLSNVSYTSSKSALSASVRHLAVRWASDGILVNVVHPAMTDTEMLRERLGDAERDALAAGLPLGRMASTQDTARVVRFLVSVENQYITGAGIDVNGGLFASA